VPAAGVLPPNCCCACSAVVRIGCCCCYSPLLLRLLGLLCACSAVARHRFRAGAPTHFGGEES
jgi:hypothetical protein